MLFFYDEKLKNNINYLKNKITELINYFTNQKNKLSKQYTIILNCMENITKEIDKIKKPEDVKDIKILFLLLDKIRNTFKSIDFNLTSIKELINKLNEIDSLCESNTDKSLISHIDELNAYYDKIKAQLNKNEENIYEFLDYYICNHNKIFNLSVNINNNIEISENSNILKNTNSDVIAKNSNTLENIESNVHLESLPYKPVAKKILQDNNVLLISEKDNMVYLPYKLDDVQKILNENVYEYSNLEDVIEQKYTISLNKFKNPVIARFRETFSLMKNRENASLPKTLDLALELSFNNLLNPAVISACKNLEELYIYLDYLDTNELDKFHIFEVKYEIMPLAK